ncbi:MAG: biotin/lipoyl-containing protein [Hyphomicrobiales bacterium]
MERHRCLQLGPSRRFVLPVTADGEDRKVELTWGEDGLSASYYGAEPDWHDEAHGATIVDAPDGVYVLTDGVQTFVRFADPAAHEEEIEAEGRVGAPMHGKLVALFVEPGQTVARGDRLFIVEAMKMEHAVSSPMDGVIAEVRGTVGDQLDQGATVVIFEEADEDKN